MAKHYTDIERYEFVRRFRISGMTQIGFCAEHGINRSTFRDWVDAYNHLNGKFINVSAVADKADNIVENQDYRVNILSEESKFKKSSHFSRFDHSIVVIEYRDMKISTSLEQAEKILEKLL